MDYPDYQSLLSMVHSSFDFIEPSRSISLISIQTDHLRFSETTSRYLLALEPLQSKEEHQITKSIVHQFLQSDGPFLHERLLKYSSDKSSYIEEFWYEAYLHHTNPVVLNLNPFFILEDDPTPSRGNQLTRAASLICASLGFIHDLRTNQLEPDSIRGTLLDMSQYSKLFGTARIPTSKGCQMRTVNESKHVVIMRRGQFYWFQVLDSQNRPCLTERELLNNLHSILQDADRLPSSEVAQRSIGLLTTETRPIWASVRSEMLMNSNPNSSCLKIIDESLFIVCLDDSSPSTANEMCSSFLSGTTQLNSNGQQIGTCTNRWYDKLQLIICDNGNAGINFEHSAVDGHTVLRFVGDIYTELILRFAHSINSSSKTLFKAKVSKEEIIDWIPKKLEWDLSNPLKTAIRFAESRLSDLICQNEVKALEFEGYGKQFIIAHHLSPDAFVQMAFQVCYFSLYGKFESTYEPAMTKSFYHGRTEGIRSVTPESVRFVHKFCSDSSLKEKLEALRVACEVHSSLSKRCGQGLGQDRILYAMFILSEGEGSIFKDPGYALLNHSILSTSNCGNPALRLFGFGPVVDDGFGLGYIIKDHGISIVGSSKHRQTQRFLDCLRSYFLEIQRMLRIEAQEPIEVPVLGGLRDLHRIKTDHQLLGDYKWKDHWGGSDLVGKKKEEGKEEEEEDGKVLNEGYGFFDLGEIDWLSDRKNPMDRQGKKLNNPPGL
ncbi:acyltransferase ChoActase/COT/CPT [Melampsora americana]|nr:acyltransferase ChoActase/COT/CPT [Melampsora americana]